MKYKIIKKINKLTNYIFCEHTHTFSFYPEEVWWSYKGETKGKHSNIVINGCCRCGKLWGEDYGR